MVTADDIKNTYSMREIVEKYGFKINRQGFIRCPFHEEDTASFKIYDKSYYCFGCRESGDIFSFMQKIECKDFKTVFSELGGNYKQTYKDMFDKEKSGINRKSIKNKVDNNRKEAFRLCDELSLETELIRLYQKYVDKSDIDSKTYADCYNALQYHSYKADVLTELIINLLTKK